MSLSTRKFIVGNWKMNGLERDLDEAREVAVALHTESAAARVAICPPFTLVDRAARLLTGSEVAVGGQDIHPKASGAHTGDVSAAMLAEAGAELVIVGHSERRRDHGETDETTAAKALAAVEGGLEPIICIGESADERRSGRALAIVEDQLRRSAPAGLAGSAFSIAYEPTWAIGTGVTPTMAEIGEVHRMIRRVLSEVFGAGPPETPILYGGSVTPANAGEIFAVAEVGGALVGGASLKAESFLSIIRAAG